MAKFKTTPLPNLDALDLTDPAERKKVSSRASKIRRKKRALTTEETSFLERWDGLAGNTGRARIEESEPEPAPFASPATSTDADASPSTVPRVAETPTAQPSSGGADEPTAPTETPSPPPSALRGPPKPAPKVLGKSGKPEGNWREKYRIAAEGRESACNEIAGAYIMLMGSLCEAIIRDGGDPIIPESALQPPTEKHGPGELYAAAVLTADKLLPANFEPGPEVTLTVGTTALVAQKVWVARKKKKAAEKPAPISTNVIPIGGQPKSAKDIETKRAEENREAAKEAQEKLLQSDRPTKKPDKSEPIPEGAVF